MSTITSADEYVKLISIEADMPSGARFHIRAPNPIELAQILRVMPEDTSGMEFRAFAQKYLPELWEHVVHPCIMKPKLPASVVHFEDSITVLAEVFKLGGLTKGGEEADESFPDDTSGEDA